MPKPASHPWRLRIDRSLGPERWRALASACLAPLWPRAPLADERLRTLADEPGPTAAALAADLPAPLRAALALAGETRDRLAHSVIAGPVDIDPLSADLFVDGRRVAPTPGPGDLLPPVRPAPDYTRRLRLRPIEREPALVLHAGGDLSIGDLAMDVLPRLAAIEALGLPEEVLLLVSVRTGMLGQFQDALADGLFRPRPVELMRQRRVIRVDTLHQVTRPLLRADIHAGAMDRLATRYRLTAQGPARSAPVLLAPQARQRADRLAARAATVLAAGDLDGAIALDPTALPLADLVAALWGAETVIAEEGATAGAFLLAGPALRRLVLLPRDRAQAPDPRPWLIARALGVECLRAG